MKDERYRGMYEAMIRSMMFENDQRTSEALVQQAKKLFDLDLSQFLTDQIKRESSSSASATPPPSPTSPTR